MKLPCYFIFISHQLFSQAQIMDILELSGLHTPPLHTHKGAPEVQLKRKT